VAMPETDVGWSNNAAIVWACNSGHAAVVAELLNATAVDVQFDSGYPLRWAAEFGHVDILRRLLADGRVEMWDTAQDYVSGSQGGRLRAWTRTRLDWAEPVQVGGGGVNVAVRYSRLNPLGDTLSSYEAVYLVTNRDGHVGVQARSTFAP